jgi:hypothetical protein
MEYRLNMFSVGLKHRLLLDDGHATEGFISCSCVAKGLHPNDATYVEGHCEVSHATNESRQVHNCDIFAFPIVELVRHCMEHTVDPLQRANVAFIAAYTAGPSDVAARHVNTKKLRTKAIEKKLIVVS